jgi:hypothetical protein
VAEVDAAVAELACERLAGRPEAEGCAAAAASASRSVEAGQWAAAWQAWYGHQMRTGRKPALDFNALNREAAAFGAEARELADLAQKRSLDRARFLSRKRVATHPLALTWLPGVRAALESAWGERVQAVAVAETWDALLVSLPAAVDLTFAFDPAGTPPELRSLPETALAARRGDLAAAEPVLLTLAISGHPQAAMMADRVRVLAGRDAAARALVEARSGRLVAGLAHLATAERLAPGDEAVVAAGVPLRASAAGERARVFGAVEASGEPAAVAAGLGQAALLLRANPSDPQDVADAYACEAWAAAISAWPAEIPERRAARLVTLGAVDRAPLAEAQRALRRALVADTARVTVADVAAGRAHDAQVRVAALKRLFPDEAGFQPPLDEALAAAAGQKLAGAIGAARAGRWGIDGALAPLRAGLRRRGARAARCPDRRRGGAGPDGPRAGPAPVDDGPGAHVGGAGPRRRPRRMARCLDGGPSGHLRPHPRRGGDRRADRGHRALHARPARGAGGPRACLGARAREPGAARLRSDRADSGPGGPARCEPVRGAARGARRARTECPDSGGSHRAHG